MGRGRPTQPCPMRFDLVERNLINSLIHLGLRRQRKTRSMDGRRCESQCHQLTPPADVFGFIRKQWPRWHATTGA